ncbi:MAG TPA: SCE4755 family polysaccharide monooxygenase-like protein [Polyangia bacterium]
MRKFVAPSILGLSLSLLGTLAPAPARAHFKLNAIDSKMDVSWMSQNDQGAPQKTGPCAAVGMGAGDPAGTPTGKVTDVKAGQMVSIAVNGTVGHPGWYRVSLVEGPSSSQTLTTLPDPALQTKCTATMINNPVWSTTQPVIGDALPAGSTATTNQSGAATLKVMIPQNANCTTAKPCTLQVVMIMTDHGPPDCFYHHCADITVSGGSNSGAGGASTGGAGGGGPSASGGAGGRMAAGGASGAAGAGDSGSASGGTSGSGGATASGGTSASGGATASGGASASGGATSSGGSSASGGATSSGGALASGGATGSGGKSSAASGGATGSGGSQSSSGSGGASPGADSSSGGCAVASGRGEAALLPMLAAFLLVIRARRRRAHR